MAAQPKTNRKITGSKVILNILKLFLTQNDDQNLLEFDSVIVLLLRFRVFLCRLKVPVCIQHPALLRTVVGILLKCFIWVHLLPN